MVCKYSVISPTGVHSLGSCKSSLSTHSVSTILYSSEIVESQSRPISVSSKLLLKLLNLFAISTIVPPVTGEEEFVSPKLAHFVKHSPALCLGSSLDQSSQSEAV